MTQEGEGIERILISRTLSLSLSSLMVGRVDAYPVPMCSVPKTKQNKPPSPPTHLFTSLSSMEDPKEEEEPQMLKSSPEFEFCMVRNPHLLFADELIADGVLVPLDLVSQVTPTLDPEPRSPPLDPSSCAASSTSSKRWTDIFKISDKKTCTTTTIVEVEEVKKKKERKSVSGSNISAAAELNINIWPFSRSWSGGNNRSKTVGCGSRKVSSAPCSRSNSAGESKSRNKPNSPRPGGGAGGIHLGRNSPVWQQVRRKEGVAAAEGRKNKSKSSSSSSSDTGGNGTSKGRGLNLSVPMCMGYRQQLSCRREDNILVDSGAAAAAEGNKLFYFRTLFTKKVH